MSIDAGWIWVVVVILAVGFAMGLSSPPRGPGTMTVGSCVNLQVMNVGYM